MLQMYSIYILYSPTYSDSMLDSKFYSTFYTIVQIGRDITFLLLLRYYTLQLVNSI
jgi:hypothetical protein